MKKFFIVLTIIFSIVFVGPEILNMWLGHKKGESIEIGSIIFLLFAGTFLFFIFRSVLKTKIRGIPGYVSKKDRENLRNLGKRITAKVVSISKDGQNLKDKRVARIYLQENGGHGNNFSYQTIVFLNKGVQIDNFKGELFDIYISLEDPERYYVDLETFIKKGKNLFYLPQ